MHTAVASRPESTASTLEEVFVEFLDAVRQASDLVAVNIAAGIAWETVQQITG